VSDDDEDEDGAVAGTLLEELGAVVAGVVVLELVACAEPVTPAITVPARVAPAAATPAAAMVALRSTGLRRLFWESDGGVACIATTITRLG
jgi:hypothetical protein